MGGIMYTIHEENYKGYSIEIIPDDYPESPREWDNLGTMYYRHRDYILGDEKIPESYFSDELGGTIYIDSAGTFAEWIEETEGKIAVMLPLYVYEHGGITINTGGYSCHWDSGQVGWIVVTKEQLRKEYNVKRITKKLLKIAEDILENEVSIFDQYLTGNIYGFRVTDNQGQEIDSCWGFYGEDSAIAEARGIVDWTVKGKQEKHLKQLKQYIAGGVPIDYRFTS